jgi:hypothetical protein
VASRPRSRKMRNLSRDKPWNPSISFSKCLVGLLLTNRLREIQSEMNPWSSRVRASLWNTFVKIVRSDQLLWNHLFWEGLVWFTKVLHKLSCTCQLSGCVSCFNYPKICVNKKKVKKIYIEWNPACKGWPVERFLGSRTVFSLHDLLRRIRHQWILFINILFSNFLLHPFLIGSLGADVTPDWVGIVRLSAGCQIPIFSGGFERARTSLRYVSQKLMVKSVRSGVQQPSIFHSVIVWVFSIFSRNSQSVLEKLMFARRDEPYQEKWLVNFFYSDRSNDSNLFRTDRSHFARARVWSCRSHNSNYVLQDAPSSRHACVRLRFRTFGSPITTFLSFHVPLAIPQLTEPYSLLIVPGGPAAPILAQNNTVCQLIQNHTLDHRALGSIGQATATVLAPCGVVNGTTVVAFPGTDDIITKYGGSVNPSDPVVFSNTRYNLTTARGPGVAQEFTLRLIDGFCGSTAVEYITNQTQLTNASYPHLHSCTRNRQQSITRGHL